jgi:hypothetical protein
VRGRPSSRLAARPVLRRTSCGIIERMKRGAERGEVQDVLESGSAAKDVLVRRLVSLSSSWDIIPEFEIGISPIV